MSVLWSSLQPAVQKALATVSDALSGRGAVENLSVLEGGRSGALLLAFSVSDAHFVLRRGIAERTENEICCMSIAAEQGIAPPLHYVDFDAGIAIMQRVGSSPRQRGEITPAERLQRIVSTLRRLHRGPAFPRKMSLLEVVRSFDESLQGQGGAAIVSDCVALQVQVAKRMAPWAHSTACHYDLNPTNILSGEDRIYFIDWETAGQGDPYVDLAQLGVFSYPTPEARKALLRAYLQRDVTAEEDERAKWSRVAALGVYAVAFMRLAAAHDPVPKQEQAALAMPELFVQLQATQGKLAPAVIASALWAETLREWALLEGA